LKTLSFAVVVGARPNLVKVAPLLRRLDSYSGVDTTLIHTGQHYDQRLSEVFFQQLGIRPPDVSLGIGSGSHAVQTGRIMEAVESLLLDRARLEQPLTRLIVVGDVNSTLAAALAAAKLQIPVAHIEAGLRSFDRTMPEEINRIVTDAVSDLFFVTEPAGVQNLLAEGHSPSQIHLVGNLMIDTLVSQLAASGALRMPEKMGLEPGRFVVVTLHRPSNVDDRAQLSRLVDALIEVSGEMPVVFPVHPRTRARLLEFDVLPRLEACPGIRLLEPLGYVELLSLVQSAATVITDSGGLQEETTYLEVPCLTMRCNTERPITVEMGSSTLIGHDTQLLLKSFHDVISGRYKRGVRPKLWDGRTAQRIAEVLAQPA
jgi:UDP-N-acetylglucosamine 2-epimerase (non-hydrolysing)